MQTPKDYRVLREKRHIHLRWEQDLVACGNNEHWPDAASAGTEDKACSTIALATSRFIMVSSTSSSYTPIITSESHRMNSEEKQLTFGIILVVSTTLVLLFGNEFSTLENSASEEFQKWRANSLHTTLKPYLSTKWISTVKSAAKSIGDCGNNRSEPRSCVRAFWGLAAEKNCQSAKSLRNFSFFPCIWNIGAECTKCF